ncbi:GNAT family N-acetyltransferase [Egibacter rhizosphaerae]|uniref:GNAT family N-acetyltransferase n=1 Tax=Egibacter rhizosphaerae TaxID=1670831 RepID=A0A411YGX9_9ACTN|nr:GNAT family N-acetyltransferase [Egibacter rhizosphaerae]QBI20494.1 GNAT family N-acetyltransferase [Egibacter rhizosphaerae]
MDIRDARRGDVPAIVSLLADDELGRQREDPNDPLPEAYWDAYAAIEADPHNRLVVVEEAGEVVGTLQLTFIPHLAFRGGWRAQVEAVRTASGRRGEGVGRRLLEWAIDEARAQGCHLIQLTTNAARDDAHRFYESLGFEASHAGMKRYLEGDVLGRRRADEVDDDAPDA